MSSLTPLIAPEVADVDPDGDGEQRRVEARSNIFMVAALASAGGTCPVRIRNMSRTGALIEGPTIPPEGSPVRLTRGSLRVHGEIVWRRENRAGVRFDSAETVADWLPGNKSATGQQRIDEIVYSYKAEEAATRSPSTAAATDGAAARSEIERELVELRASLVAVAEELAGDDATMERHPKALQVIDVVAQKIEKIARQLLDLKL